MIRPSFIESIRVENGRFQNIDYHQSRIDFTANKFLLEKRLDLGSINLPYLKENTIYKSRIIYSDYTYFIEFTEYRKRDIRSLKLVYDNNIDYGFKFEKRESLDSLFNRREDCSDILIIKNGFITDTSFSNIVLFDGEDYYTPNTYLLNGIMRQSLLDRNLINEKEIGVDDIRNYKRIFLINALNSLKDNLSVEVSSIY